MGIKKEDARFVLPNDTEILLVLTANLREWRHIIELRGDLAAQWEIRKMVIKIQYINIVYNRKLYKYIIVYIK